MSDYKDGRWITQTPVRHVVKVTTFPRNQSHTVIQHHRGYQAVIVRQNPDTGKPEYKRCGQAHKKVSGAKRCAEQMARYWNKQDNPEDEGQ